MALFLALLAAGGGYFAWLKYPSEFFSSSLLSYEDPGQFLSGQSATQPGTIAIADAVFSDEQLTRLAATIHYQPEGPAADDDPGMSVAQDLRSHLDFEQPAAGLLEVIVRGKDQGQVQRTANALVALLTEWKPAQGTEVAAASSSAVPRNASVPAAAKQPVTVARIQLQLRVLGENYATLKLQKQSTEQQIKQLSARQLALESGTPDGGTSSLASTVKELGRLRLLDVSLSTEMARIRAQYGPLRDRIAQLRSQEGENGAPVAQPAEAGVDTELTAASPGAPPVASHADQAGGQFTVLEPPTASRPLNDGLRRWAPWAGGAAAGLLGLAYFLWMAWRYRAVEDAASTRRYLPADAPYYGAIIGKPLAGGSR